MQITVTIKNLDVWKRKVNAAPINLNHDSEALMVETAADMAREMAGMVPSDSGALRDSIKAEGGEISIGEGLDYALAVEFGHMDKGTHVPPQPFYRPALRMALRAMAAKRAELPPKAFR